MPVPPPPDRFDQIVQGLSRTCAVCGLQAQSIVMRPIIGPRGVLFQCHGEQEFLELSDAMINYPRITDKLYTRRPFGERDVTGPKRYPAAVIQRTAADLDEVEELMEERNALRQELEAMKSSARLSDTVEVRDRDGNVVRAIGIATQGSTTAEWWTMAMLPTGVNLVPPKPPAPNPNDYAAPDSGPRVINLEE